MQWEDSRIVRLQKKDKKDLANGVAKEVIERRQKVSDTGNRAPVEPKRELKQWVCRLPNSRKVSPSIPLILYTGSSFEIVDSKKEVDSTYTRTSHVIEKPAYTLGFSYYASASFLKNLQAAETQNIQHEISWASYLVI